MEIRRAFHYRQVNTRRNDGSFYRSNHTRHLVTRYLKWVELQLPIIRVTMLTEARRIERAKHFSAFGTAAIPQEQN